MIQRIQTLYLTAATALMACAFWLPLATFFGQGEEIVLRSMEWWPLAVLLGLTAGLLFVVIFLYKRRLLQLRLCFSAAVLTLGSQGFVAYYIWQLSTNPSVMTWKMAAPAVFPLAAFVFVLLAIRGIIRDLRLIRSLDRIR